MHLPVNPAEHPEGFPGKVRKIDLLRKCLLAAQILLDHQVSHLINPVMPDHLPALIIRNQIIILIIPYQVQRAYIIIRTVMPRHCRLSHGPFDILVCNLVVLEDRAVNPVNVVIDGLVQSFGTVIYRDLTAQLFRFIPAAQRLQLSDQLCGLFLCDKL